MSRDVRHPVTVVYDPGAALELRADVRTPEERVAIVNVVSKLRELDEQLQSPHCRPLHGPGASGLWELRPRRSQSGWRLLYVRRDSGYVIVAIGRHANIDAVIARAQRRAARYADVPPGFVTHEELVAAHVTWDPDLAEEWGRLGLARAVAVELIRFRSAGGLSQRALSNLLGVSQPRVVELESGETNPTVDTIATIAAATGLEFAIDIAPVGRTPRLVSRLVLESGAHVHGGASVLVGVR